MLLVCLSAPLPARRFLGALALEIPAAYGPGRPAGGWCFWAGDQFWTDAALGPLGYTATSAYAVGGARWAALNDSDRRDGAEAASRLSAFGGRLPVWVT